MQIRKFSSFLGNSELTFPLFLLNRIFINDLVVVPTDLIVLITKTLRRCSHSYISRQEVKIVAKMRLVLRSCYWWQSCWDPTIVQDIVIDQTSIMKLLQRPLCLRVLKSGLPRVIILLKLAALGIELRVM